MRAQPHSGLYRINKGFCFKKGKVKSKKKDMTEEPKKVETPEVTPEVTPTPEPKKEEEEVKPEEPKVEGTGEVEKLTEDLLEVSAQKDKLQGDLDGAVGELIELRKKKSISPEEKEKLDEEIIQLKLDKKSLGDEMGKAKGQRNEIVLNSMATTPSVDPSPKSVSGNELSPWEDKLRQEKGWTVERFLSVKAKHPEIVKPYK